MKIYASLLSLSLMLIISCSRQQYALIKGRTMGTYYAVKILADCGGCDALRKDIDELLEQVNDDFSTYRAHSKLSLLNSSESILPQAVAPTLYVLLDRALAISKESLGAFDPTVGPLVNLWGFGPEGVRRRPHKDEVERVAAFIGIDKLKLLDNGQVQKMHPKMYVDLSAIAKGYGVDKVHDLLQSKGIKAAMVEIGGEVRTYGRKIDGDDWRIGIEGPHLNVGESIQKVVPLREMAMATSGNYRNFVKYNSEIFGHTIDPRTLAPAKHQLVSATVLAKDCATADAWATAFMVLGEEEGMKLAQEKEILVYFLVQTERQIKAISSKKFKEYIKLVGGQL